MANKPFSEYEDAATKRGQANLALINNPFANAIIQGYTGFQVGQQLGPTLPGGGYQTQSDIASLIGGAAAGGQRLQEQQQLQLENANFEDVAPQMATQFPQLAKLRAKDAYPLVKDMMLQQAKQPKSITEGTKAQLKRLRPELTEEQLMTIDEPTATKYVLENTKEQGKMTRFTGDIPSAEMVSSFSKELGITPEVATQLGKRGLIMAYRDKVKAEKYRPEVDTNVVYNDYGIPVSIEVTKPTGTQVINIGGNQKATETAIALDRARKTFDRLFEKAIELQPSHNAWIQRAKGRGLTWANALGLGGELGQAYGNLQNEAEGLSSMLSKGVLMESGALAQGDVSRALSLLAKPSLTPNELQMLRDTLNSIFNQGESAISKSVRPVLGKGKKDGDSPTPKSGAFSDDAFDKFMGN